MPQIRTEIYNDEALKANANSSNRANSSVMSVTGPRTRGVTELLQSSDASGHRKAEELYMLEFIEASL